MFKKAPTPNDWHSYVEERLSAYIDGQLTDEERGEVRKHLQECERCQASLDSLGWTIKLVKQVPAPPLPRQFTLPVPEPKRAPAMAGWLKWGLGAASVVAASAFVILLTIDLLTPRVPGNLAMAPAAAPTTAAFAQPAAQAVPTQAPALDRSSKAIPPAAQPTAAPPLAPQIESQPAVAATAAPQPNHVAPPPTQAPRPAAPSEPTRERSVAKQAPTASGAFECQGCGGGTSETLTPPSTANGLGGGPSDSSAQTPPVPPGMGIASAAGTPTQQADRPMVSAAASGLAVITGSVTVTTSLWVLAGPSNASEKIGALLPGATVQVVGRDTEGYWLQIIYPLENDSERRGWVSEKFVTLSVPLNDVPIVEPTSPSPTPSPRSMIVPRGRTKTAAPVRTAHAPSVISPSAVPSATETSPPTHTATSTVTRTPTYTPTATPTRTYTPTPSETPTPTAPILSPTPLPTTQPLSTTQDNGISSLRLAELASLVFALIFGAMALLRSRL